MDDRAPAADTGFAIACNEGVQVTCGRDAVAERCGRSRTTNRTATRS